MKKPLHLLYAILALAVGWNASAQGLTCATALPVTPGSFTASTLTGTPSTPGLNGNGVALTAGWYAYTPTANGILNINSCGGGSDTRLWVWSGTCAALTPVANNDDFAGCISTGTTAYASKIENIIVTTGNTYYFEWDNQWEATGFTWNFTFTALPMNNDAGITYVSNRYTRVPIAQASAGIPFGATINNFSGSSLTNVVLTTEIFELPNTTTPVQTLTSTPVTLAIGASQVISCGTWSPVLTASKSYLVKYTKTQTQVDGVTSNDVTTQNLTLDFNYYARDNNTYLTGYNWSSTNFTWKQGNFYNFYGADNVTGVSYYVASTSTTQAYNILVYSVTNGVVSANPVYSGPSITANGAGWRFHTFTTPLAVTAGSEFLFVVNHVGPTTAGGFPLGVSSTTHTAGKSVIKVGTGAWTSTETYGVSVVFMMRPKFGSDPTSDIAFLNNRNPGGENTKIHTRQSLTGNDLQFWARAANIGTATVNGVTMTVTVKDASNATVYTATSVAQDLTAGQIDTFTVANYNVTALGAYTIDYVFNNTGDQVPQNNTKTTSFTRTTGEMSRTVGVTGSLGLNATTVANNIVFGNNYVLTQNDFLDSVMFVLNPGTPVGYVASANIYGTTLNATTGAMVPNLTSIASTVTYTTTAADNLNGAIIKLPISGGTLNLTPGTYFVGVYQASSSNGNIRLATSTDYSSPGMTYYRWDQANSGNWQSPASINYSFVVNPIFKSCVAYNQTVATTAASCGANDGAATVSTTGGTGTINYAWANGNATATISNVAAGQYGLTLSDINGCPLTFNVVVPSQSNLTVSAVTQDVTCGGQSTGSIALTASQGVTPYVYSWSNNLGSAATLNNIPAGTYQVTVSDATGCIVIFNDTVVELSNITGTMNGTDVLCNSTQTGNLEMSAASGVAPYTYQWIGTSNTSTYVTSVGPGTYTCVVTDGLGCTDTVVTILAVSNIAATASASNPLCYGTNTGSVTVSATGGLAPYSYDWAGSTVSTMTLSGLGEGAYSCVVTDAYGCSTSASATVAEPAAWTVSAAVTPAIFGADGAIDLSVSGSTSPYTFSWDNNATTEDLSNLDGGNYIVTITDGAGCTYTDTIVVGSLVGLETQNLEETVVYPNPNNGAMFIVGAAVEQVALYNQLGQRIAFEMITLGENAREIKVSNVASGTYILELQGAEQVLRKSIQIFQ